MTIKTNPFIPTTSLTDVLGETCQYVAYLPRVEIFVEERNTQTDRNPYLYNGKELDEMTGLYYYGARYYDASVGLFLGVDPMVEKYLSLSPYNYAVNNPIRFIDIKGLGPGDRVKAARSLTGIKYKRETSHYLRTANTPEAMQYMDCSEFVCRVLALDQITDGVKHMNSSGLKAFLDNKERFEFSTTPRVGDIAVWKGHVGIVTEVGENGNIKLTHARGKNKPSKENKAAIAPEGYRPGSTFFGYYRPLVETPDGKLEGGDVITTQVEEDNTVFEGGILNSVTVVGQGTTTLSPITEVKVEPIK